MSELCPRCELNRFTPPGTSDYEPGYDPPFPALSRSDNHTYVCSACGVDEAIRDFFGANRVPPQEWPMSERYA